jgi:ATP/ADP translocase
MLPLLDLGLTTSNFYELLDSIDSNLWIDFALLGVVLYPFCDAINLEVRPDLAD